VTHPLRALTRTTTWTPRTLSDARPSLTRRTSARRTLLALSRSAVVRHRAGVDEHVTVDGDTRFVRTANSRRLAFCEWGDPDGPAIFYLHGTPGSRYLRHVGDLYVDADLRVITYDRPGYGLSAPAPGRIVADTAADVAAIADHLGLERFSVVGVSAGGVHAFAVAAVLPDRVSRCVGLKALAPYPADGLDFYAGMDPTDAASFRLLVTGDREALAADAEETRAWIESGMPGLTETGPSRDVLAQAFNEAFRRGLEGHIDDWAAHVRGHGYDIESVRTPTWLMAARDDQQVPPGHGRWLADHLHHARLVWVDGGHFDDQEPEEMEAFIWAGHGLEPR